MQFPLEKRRRKEALEKVNDCLKVGVPVFGESSPVSLPFGNYSSYLLLKNDAVADIHDVLDGDVEVVNLLTLR